MNRNKGSAALTAAHEWNVKTPILRARNRCFLFSRTGKPSPFIGLVFRLRWVIPVLIALIGAGYMFVEQVVLEGNSVSSYHVIRSVLMIGLVGPIIPWLILTWATRIASAEAEAQRELSARNRELTALNVVSEVTSQSLNLDKILQTALEKLIELTGMEAGEMRLLEDEDLVIRAHNGISQIQREEKSVPLGQCLCGRCARMGQTLWVNNVRDEPCLANSLCTREGFQSIISVPIKTKEKVLGVMLLGSRNSNPIAIPDQRVLTAIAYRVAAAVENAKLYQQARRRAIHLETASLVGQSMISVLDLDSLLAIVVQVIGTKFGYYHIGIFLVDAQANEIVLKEACGVSAALIKARRVRLKIGHEGITGWVAYTGQTLVCNDVSREPRYVAVELVPGTQSELAVPLRVGNRVIGVLDVQSDRRDAFDKEDVTVLQILGNQVGIAIRNAQLFQETQHRYEAMIALHETSLDMIAQLDTHKLLDALLRRGTQLLGAQAGAFFLYDEMRELIYNVASYNTWEDLAGVTLQLGEGLVGRVIQTGQPMIENDYDSWSGRAQVFAGTRQTRVVSVPLKWQNRIIGGINIVNDSKGRPFDDNDIWLLAMFADLASIGIKNAELHTEIKEFSQELELKVEERTEELSRAKDEIMLKAEQLRSLLAKTIDIQEQERARIARDMHDGVVQLISAARFELQAAKTFAGSALTSTVEEKLDTTHQVLEEMEKEIRRAIYNLHPPILDVVGFAPALQKYLASFQELSGIACEMQITGAPYRLPQATEIALFRMVQQTLQNIAAHADAETASVTVNYGPELLYVSVQDDGVGFDYKQWVADRQSNHLGLLGMRERIENLGGMMDVRSDVGCGTQVLFQFPVVQDEVEL